jgi:superfamily II DNA or RNA helicase
MRFRDYQSDILAQLDVSRENALVQLDTGAGKTPIEAALALNAERCIVIGHRNLLIAQISAKLAAMGVMHGIIGTEHTRRRCMIEHRRHGHRVHLADSSASASVFAASIQSLVAHYRRGRLGLDTAAEWVIVIDEAHHALRENLWGRLVEIFPRARFLGFTATPCRADGQSLRAGHGGIFSALVQAEALRKDSVSTLIDRGFLSPFRCWSIRSITNEERLRIGESGDYTQPSLCASLSGTQIVGDAVREYRRLAQGKRAVAMCVAIKNAEETADDFRAAGIPASVISSHLSAVEVARRIDAFQTGEINVLCNVDMVGEGFDMPGIDALIMLRKTASFARYRQWIGRALRPVNGKPYAIIIDHVGNIAAHGLPDEHVEWRLDQAPGRHCAERHIPCPDCRRLFECWRKQCPDCGAGNPLLHRTSIGGHYVNIEKIDRMLIEIARSRAAQTDFAEKLKAEIVVPETLKAWKNGDAIHALCHRLLEWFIASVSCVKSPSEMNQFLMSHQARNTRFWIDRFSIKDLSGNPAKAIQEFEKWQKSH